jgi:hypothetical protein
MNNTGARKDSTIIKVKTENYPQANLPALHLAMQASVFQFLPNQSLADPKPIIRYADTYSAAMSELTNFLAGLKRFPLVIAVNIEGICDRPPLAQRQSTPLFDLPVPNNNMKVPFARLIRISRLDGLTLILDLPPIFQSWLQLKRPIGRSLYSTYLPPLLSTILQSSTVIKVFCGVKLDLDYLRITCAVEPRHFVDLSDLYNYLRKHQQLTSPYEFEATVTQKSIIQNVLGIKPPEISDQKKSQYRNEMKLTDVFLNHTASYTFFTILSAFSIFHMLKREKPTQFSNFHKVCEEFAYINTTDYFLRHHLNNTGPTSLIPLIPPATAPQLMQLIMNPNSNGVGIVLPSRTINRANN